jgi:hypothetical protein
MPDTAEPEQPAVRASSAADDRREHETKFVFDNRRSHAVRRWLELRCPPDPLHPAYVVRSIYFDTPSWRSLGEKANSDFYKSKIRLRWYADRETREPTGSVRLEVKLKRGKRRAKARFPVDVPSAALTSGALQDLVKPDVAGLLRTHGLDVSSPLRPVFQIDYTRSRFVHPLSGSSLCLDYDILVPRVNRSMVSRHDPRLLTQAVFEIKGRSTELMPDLGFLVRLGCRKQSFSKYLACYRRVTGGID